jgi:hypothetical protein
MKNLISELKMGFIIALSLGVYFLIIEGLGLSDVAFLRLFNITFVLLGINMTIRSNISKGHTKYLKNFGSSLATAFSGIIFSIIGLWLYISIFKGDAYLSELAASVIINNDSISLNQFCVALLIEGLSSSFILVFILMQYWKNVKEVTISQFTQKII